MPKATATSVIVLGGGMVGFGAALALRERGFDVLLLDRSEPGRETSYGNAGILQGEAVEPYALPRDPRMLSRIALGRENSVAWDLRGLAASARVLATYWRFSQPGRYRRVVQSYAPLVRRATADHDPLIAAAGAGGLIRREGYRTVFRTASDFDRHARLARRARDAHGLSLRIEDGDALARAEPALKRRLAGAILWQDAWTCADPGGLVSAYADLFRSRGGRIERADVAAISPRDPGWRAETSAGPRDAAQMVVALGPWSPAMLAPLGYRIRMVRKRGYHLHFAPPRSGGPTGRNLTGLDLPVLDAANGAVLSPMRAGLRIATGADLSATAPTGRPPQLARAAAGAAELLDLGEAVETEAWSGIRPCMPDMLPVIGAAPRHAGLWFDFGHGHQGFTLGPTSGTLLADAICGAPQPGSEDFDPARLGGR